MRFRDKTAYVWGLRYRWDPSLSRNLIPRFPHFVPPCWTRKLFLRKETSSCDGIEHVFTVLEQLLLDESTIFWERKLGDAMVSNMWLKRRMRLGRSRGWENKFLKKENPTHILLLESPCSFVRPSVRNKICRIIDTCTIHTCTIHTCMLQDRGPGS